ncbi:MULTISPECIES: hypothetical protein [Pantoea]|uniref:Uncharacterized protein n=1 Tax=Candidatus Pantoea floridensis TaxID=1938870 RepID=A0A286C015_9GAMM|nr:MULTISPECIES: hypothetical protein [Pantoea]PIF22242.1 hypothetical protein BX596_1651 [Enterobacteriaceae bacterium JKS000233]PXW18476.1 hypothetical protein BY447_0029 [Pantoea sp. JKS000250]SOD39749.1 hypothetical protein SAMN06273570_4203 [Pantoea floridensis]
MSVTSTGVSTGAANANADMFQSQMDAIEAKSMQNTLDKAERDVKDAYVSGYQNSITTMISSQNTDKINF